jgi:hypothetical protein
MKAQVAVRGFGEEQSVGSLRPPYCKSHAYARSSKHYLPIQSLKDTINTGISAYNFQTDQISCNAGETRHASNDSSLIFSIEVRGSA